MGASALAEEVQAARIRMTNRVSRGAVFFMAFLLVEVVRGERREAGDCSAEAAGRVVFLRER
jgi:hypothetical protein